MVFCFESFSTPPFRLLEFPLLQFFLEEVENVLLIGARVPLDDGSKHSFPPNIQHFFDVARRQQIVKAFQSHVLLFVIEISLQSDNREVSVDEPVKVQPESVDSVDLKRSDNFMGLKCAAQFEHLNVLHEHGQIHVLGDLLVLLE